MPTCDLRRALLLNPLCSHLVLLQLEVLPLALRLLLHALVELLPGHLHGALLLLQLLHVQLALLVQLLGVLQGLACRLQLLDLVGGVLFGLDVLGTLLVQLRVLLPGRDEEEEEGMNTLSLPRLTSNYIYSALHLYSPPWMFYPFFAFINQSWSIQVGFFDKNFLPLDHGVFHMPFG